VFGGGKELEVETQSLNVIVVEQENGSSAD
jgi:hypothetical protein